MTDAIGQPLSVGDKVLAYGRYIRTIAKITPKKVRLFAEDGSIASAIEPENVVLFAAQYSYAVTTWPEYFI